LRSSETGKVGSHLFALNLGLKLIGWGRRKSPVRTTRLLAFLAAIAEPASAGLKEIDRLAMATGQMERRLRNRRSSASLLELIELVLARPVVSAGLIREEVKVSQRAALHLIRELGIREMAGRGRYRAWGSYGPDPGWLGVRISSGAPFHYRGEMKQGTSNLPMFENRLA
jgi:hypothetical protein